jgi:hypothetical protein
MQDIAMIELYKKKEKNMGTEFPVKEGYVNFRGYKIWYRIVGDVEEPGKYPLL